MFEHHATNQRKLAIKKLEMILHVCLFNWLNDTTNEKINDLCESIISQSESIGCQGIKLWIETINGADNYIKNESCNLSLIFAWHPMCIMSF